MTHIHPDSIRMLLRCGFTPLLADSGAMWWQRDCVNYTTTEALALCRGAEQENVDA